MSLILKGIDLPKENGFHIITIWSDGIIYARTVEGLNETTIDKAEAIQIPETEERCEEWCTDCKEYDQEKHCCPRFNRVIRQTLEELLVRVEAKQNEGLYLETDEDTLLETEYIVLSTDGMYKEYVHENE